MSRSFSQTSAPKVALADDASAANNENAPDIASSSERYALRFAGRAGRYLLDRQESGIRRLLQHAKRTGSPSLRVLDVGGGHMQTAPLLASLGHSVSVHGSTEACLFRLSAAAGSNSQRLRPIVGSMFQLPVATRSFDLVISIRMLGHVGRWRELIEELCRASDRFVIIEFATESGAQSMARMLFAAKRLVEGDTRHYATYSVAQITDHLAGLGYRVIAVDRQFMLPIVIHRIMKMPAFSSKLEAVFAKLGFTARFGGPALLLAERDAN